MKNRVEEYRKKLGLTQEELSEESQVSRTTISDLERKTNVNIQYNTMKKISDALNEPVNVIFFEEQVQHDEQRINGDLTQT